jgi:predicted acylesterase/phospholipase RssA
MRLVLSAGGQMGLAYIGAMRALEFKYQRRNLSEVFSSFEGTSSGAMCAFLLSLGFSSMEILLYYQQVPDYVPDFTGIANRFGLGRIDHLLQRVLESVFKAAGIPENELLAITFGRFYSLTKVRTVIGMTIIGPEDREIEASHETVPDWPIIPCLMSSMAIPGVFEPVEIQTPDGKIYAVDGALSNAFRYPGKPLRDHSGPDSVLGILLLSKPRPSGFSPTTHTMLTFFTFICERFFNYVATARSRELHGIIKIFCDSEVNIIAKPSQETIQRLIRAGERSAEEHFRQESAALRQDSAALRQESAALRQESAALRQESAASNQQEIAAASREESAALRQESAASHRQENVLPRAENAD